MIKNKKTGINYSNFSDLFLFISELESYDFRESYFSPSLQPLPAVKKAPILTELEALDDYVEQRNEIIFKSLLHVIKVSYDRFKDGKTEQNVSVTNLDGRVFRCVFMPSRNGDLVHVRAMPSTIWPLNSCFKDLSENWRKQLSSYLSAERLTHGGLILVAGVNGGGKSTTCASILAHRLERFGGHAHTIEDPIEFNLQGRHGDQGYCIQREVSNDFKMEDALRDTLRAYPTSSNNYLLLGEVRDSKTAEIALKSANDGRLVLTTLHASSEIEACRRIITLAAKHTGYEEAHGLLAASLRCVIHQRIVDEKLKVGCLFDTQTIYSSLLNPDNFPQIVNHRDNQKINIDSGNLIVDKSLRELK